MIPWGRLESRESKTDFWPNSRLDVLDLFAFHLLDAISISSYHKEGLANWTHLKELIILLKHGIKEG